MTYKPIDKRSRKAMTAFLKNHFRYHTMQSWNQSTSYANNIKLHHIDQPSDINEEAWWQMLDMHLWHDTFNGLLDDFGRNHDWRWQAGINGRSGGYVVLYHGGSKPSGYQSHCTHCGQKNYQALPEGQTGTCGRCGAQARLISIKSTWRSSHGRARAWTCPWISRIGPSVIYKPGSN